MDNSLVLVFGLDNIVDFFSSAIVLWRFNDNNDDNNNDIHNNDHNDQKSIKREKRASIGVTIVLTFLGFIGLITSIEDLNRGPMEIYHDAAEKTILVISFLSFVIFGILAKFKFHYAKILHSPSLRKDGLCSLNGCVLGFTMFFSAMVTISSEEGSSNGWWWLDPVVAFICALGAFGYGWYGIHKAWVKDGYPIFSYQWWLYGGGKERDDGNRENNNDDLEQQGKTKSMVKNISMTDLSLVPSDSENSDMNDVVFT